MTPRRQAPTEAIFKLLADELRTVIRGLPDDIQRSLPEELQDEIGTLDQEDSTADD
jgi:hypothetical protein